MSECKSCKRAVRWAVTDAGNWMPVDAEPAGHGNIVLSERGTEPPRATYVDVREQNERRDGGLPLWISHFATCANATRHRRGPA